MARNKVMKLWTAIVTAFLALCTALGFITTTAAQRPYPGPIRRATARRPGLTVPASPSDPGPMCGPCPPR